MSDITLTCENITKSFGKKEVLKGVNLTLEPHKIYGLIGRNGAGKTTLLSILTAQNFADSGVVHLNGEAVWENEKALSHICFSREIPQMLLMGQNT
ncbi:MAG: ATP-binding cassette domain-containing protein, partial [Oscillospiraceae bacterium]